MEYHHLFAECLSGFRKWDHPEIPQNHTYVLVLVTDQGSDCSKAGRTFMAEVEGKHGVFIMQVFCFMHQLHLCQKRAFVAIDKLLDGNYITELCRPLLFN